MPDGVVRDEPESWPVHDSVDLWRGKAPFAVRMDTISAPSRPEERFDRVVVEHPGAVVVLAVDDEERALVLRQYRHAARMRFLELPAGLLDVPGEDPLVAARRELLEEVGHTAEEWTHLLTTYSSPGVLAERVEVYLARGLTESSDRGGFEPVHEEAEMTVSWEPVSDLVEGVLARRLTDAPTALAVMAYALRSGSPGDAVRRA